MPGRHRSREQREADLEEVARLSLQRWSIRRIAAQVGMSRTAIENDLKLLRSRWLAAQQELIAEKVARELAQIDLEEREAWEAWQRSQKPEETLHAGTTKGRTTSRGEPLPDLVKSYKTQKGQMGDPRFLEVIARCRRDRCDLLGLNAPLKSETKVLTEVCADDMTDEELTAIIRRGEEELRRQQELSPGA